MKRRWITLLAGMLQLSPFACMAADEFTLVCRVEVLRPYSGPLKNEVNLIIRAMSEAAANIKADLIPVRIDQQSSSCVVTLKGNVAEDRWPLEMKLASPSEGLEIIEVDLPIQSDGSPDDKAKTLGEAAIHEIRRELAMPDIATKILQLRLNQHPHRGLSVDTRDSSEAWGLLPFSYHDYKGLEASEFYGFYQNDNRLLVGRGCRANKNGQEMLRFRSTELHTQENELKDVVVTFVRYSVPASFGCSASNPRQGPMQKAIQ